MRQPTFDSAFDLIFGLAFSCASCTPITKIQVPLERLNGTALIVILLDRPRLPLARLVVRIRLPRALKP
jgi:hypothetical protein